MKKTISFKELKQLMHILKPLIPHMILTIMLGTLGYLAITAITVLGGMAVLQWSGFAHYQTFSILISGIVAAGVLRAIFRLSEQYCTHYIAFRILALVRDQIYATLRKL
ncbi:MAG: ABC transporter ATP-binding protein, partial [Bacillus sp. (in: firmicutes)]